MKLSQLWQKQQKMHKMLKCARVHSLCGVFFIPSMEHDIVKDYNIIFKFAGVHLECCGFVSYYQRRPNYAPYLCIFLFLIKWKIIPYVCRIPSRVLCLESLSFTQRKSYFNSLFHNLHMFAGVHSQCGVLGSRLLYEIFFSCLQESILSVLFSDHGYCMTYSSHVCRSPSSVWCSRITVTVWHILLMFAGVHSKCGVLGSRLLYEIFFSCLQESILSVFLAHLSTKCSGWAIVIGLCPSSVVVRRASSVVRRP